MKISLIDKTVIHKPDQDVLEAIVLATQKVVANACRHWGAFMATISEQLDGYPVELHDELDIQGALGYHDNGPNGPFGAIGVGTVLSNGGSWLHGAVSVSAVVGHEVLEMLCDPIANRWADEDQTTSWAVELCDGVENVVKSVWVQPVVGGRLISVAVPDFLYPSYFNPFGKAPFDAMGVVTAPFDYSNGYAIRKRGGRVDAVFGEQTPAFIQAAKMHAKSRYADRGGVVL